MKNAMLLSMIVLMLVGISFAEEKYVDAEEFELMKNRHESVQKLVKLHIEYLEMKCSLLTRKEDSQIRFDELEVAYERDRQRITTEMRMSEATIKAKFDAAEAKKEMTELLIAAIRIGHLEERIEQIKRIHKDNIYDVQEDMLYIEILEGNLNDIYEEYPKLRELLEVPEEKKKADKELEEALLDAKITEHIFKSIKLTPLVERLAEVPDGEK
jgi:ACT domain-containing protein